MKQTTTIFFLLLLLVILSTSCRIMLIGNYDAITDENIQTIQSDVSELLVKIETNMLDTLPQLNKYEVLKPDFEVIEGAIKSTRIRCGALPKYNIITKQVQLLNDNVVLLEKFSKTSFSEPTIRIIDSTFTVQFQAIIALQNGLKRQK